MPFCLRAQWALLCLLAGAVAAPATAAGRTYTIEIRDMAFGRLPSALRKGDVVQWVNEDMFRHTATATDGSFDVDLPPNARARTELREVGDISFYCRFHPGMAGTLTVVP
jgi:plastocyanin